MKWYKLMAILGACLFGIFLAAACTPVPANTSAPSDADILLTAQASNPLPTEFANQGLSVVKTQACLVDTFVSVQVNDENTLPQMNDPQGDMIAWSPVGDELAYVTPTNGRWAWFVGDLVVFDMKTNKVIFTSQNQQVSGDLTWSPDGKWLAYIVLDAKSKIYTIDVLDMQTGTSQDIFTAISPQTDNWASPKGITGWANANTLMVTSDCDVDCSRSYSYDLQSGKLTAQGDGRKKDDLSLNVTNQLVSPDAKWQVAVDINNNAWISAKTSGQASIISSGSPIDEIKWSHDSSYLAMRTDDSIILYEPVCTK